ncbi:thioredoxin domain-containing protein [Candidatus Peregrinibacteria bacterium]|jgi:protein-disulfide isomerase|nr:thioredoxin domain-containing protein [Candidatus Peregrinibacteria bacterium]MBT5468473.1 thioredoxin domain-containing protein [Candidatus Peregrinibacteria bacterium]MBT7337293.1 thioredoxin domain-containing protein [Candidatus Peregrinibacteria bacterium]
MKKLLSLSILSTSLLVACGGDSDVSVRPPKGNANAVVIVEEFADLQCPACSAAHSQVTAPLLAKYSNDIRFEFNHFPLRSIHRFALDAAEMSECAADQGKFWEFVDIAYEKQKDLGLETLMDWAEVIGLDTDIAERCWKSHSKRDIVLNDYKEGRDRDVAGTPTFFVNGKRVKTGVDTLGAAIEAALKGNQMPL